MLELSRGAPQDGHEFSSRGTGSHAVNPPPNPRDDDKVDFGSTAPGREDSRREVLRSLTSRRDSSAGDAFASPSFSLKVEESLQRFPFRRSRKRNSRVDEALPAPRMPREDSEIEEDPAGHLGPLNDEESSSRSQFRRADAECPHTSVVKLMDSQGNSSCDPTINSTAPRREPEELSRDSPPLRGGSAGRSFPESLGGETVERNALMQFETVSGNGTEMRPREEESTGDGRDVSTIRPYPSSEFKRSRRQTPRKNHGFPSDATIPQKSREGGDVVRVARSAASSSNIGHFVGDYKDSASQSAQHSPTVSQASRDPNQLSLAQQSTVVYGIRSFVIAVFRTLGMFVQVGRQVIDVVQTNAALDCTREYLWTKFVKWIDT